MKIKRRDFIKGCAAACVLSVPGIALATKGANANVNNTAASDTNTQIQKSIKAGFGGGFSVRAHSRSGGFTYADIEHFDTRYSVVSTDLLDWKIVSPL